MDRGGRERDGGSRPMGDEDRRSRYPDNQQLFVGNLPHTISENELISYFESKSLHLLSSFYFCVYSQTNPVSQ